MNYPAGSKAPVDLPWHHQHLSIIHTPNNGNDPHATFACVLPRDLDQLAKRPQSNLTTIPTATMASSASKRLFKEYKGLCNDPPEGLTAGPISEDDMFLWEAMIIGPEGTPFEGGVFPAELKFPKDYPLAPPTMKFTVDMWHPNGTVPAFMRKLICRYGC